MKLCIPITEDKGLESPVCEHFGAAPGFLLIDSESEECHAIANDTAHHTHGMCQPVAVLAGQGVEGMVVCGIGMGALNKLQAGGTQVYVSHLKTVREVLDALKVGDLKPATVDAACGGRRSGGYHD